MGTHWCQCHHASMEKTPPQTKEMGVSGDGGPGVSRDGAWPQRFELSCGCDVGPGRRISVPNTGSKPGVRAGSIPEDLEGDRCQKHPQPEPDSSGGHAPASVTAGDTGRHSRGRSTCGLFACTPHAQWKVGCPILRQGCPWRPRVQVPERLRTGDAGVLTSRLLADMASCLGAHVLPRGRHLLLSDGTSSPQPLESS